MPQRIGAFSSAQILVTVSNVPAIRDWLQTKAEYIKNFGILSYEA